MSSRKIFQELLDEAQKSKLNEEEIRKSLASLRRQGSGRRTAESYAASPRLMTGLLVVSLALSQYEMLATLQTKMASFLSQPDDPQCLLRMPFDSKNVFRSPVDCAICRDVRQVDVVDHISPQEFAEKYAYSGRPLIVRDALVNWTAVQYFSFDFFKELYLTNLSRVSGYYSDRCQFFPYKTEFRNLREALSMNEQRKSQPWYFGWSNCDSEAADLLRRHYSRPYFLPVYSESSRTDWIFIGTSGLGAHMHVDHVGLPSWQAQIRGQKLWSLEPPPECFYQCQPMEVIVKTGDTIVLDTNIWYHKTSVVSIENSIVIGSEFD